MSECLYKILLSFTNKVKGTSIIKGVMMTNELRLRDKVAIITGAGSSGPGIGN